MKNKIEEVIVNMIKGKTRGYLNQYYSGRNDTFLIKRS